MKKRKLKDEILTIGSDSHCAEDVAKGVDAAAEIASEAGFKYLTVFTKRIPDWISIEKKQIPTI